MRYRIINKPLFKKLMKGRTATEVGALAECSESLIRVCMNRKIKSPAAPFARAIANVLGADYEELFPWSDQESSQKAS